MEEQHVELIGSAKNVLAELQCLVMDLLVSGRAVTHLEKRHAASLIVDELGLRFLEDAQGQRARPGAEVDCSHALAST